ncbi:MAG: hypothetical protein WCB05_16955 [Candidatus Sulfotelmatobacter sp.]
MDTRQQLPEGYKSSFSANASSHDAGEPAVSNSSDVQFFDHPPLRRVSRFLGGHLANLLSWYRY